MGWVSWPLFSFVFLASILALWWPNIWPRMGFPELFEKNIGPINFIPGIYPYGVSLLTPIYFRVPSLIFGPLVAKYLVENRVFGTLCKNYWFHSLHTWHLPWWGESLAPYSFVFLAPFTATIFGSDQSGDIFPHLWALLVSNNSMTMTDLWQEVQH